MFICGLLQSRTRWEFPPHETWQFSEGLYSSGSQVNYTFCNPSVNSNSQSKCLLLFIVILAPCELHENYNIQWKTEPAEAAQPDLYLHESALPDLFPKL